MRCMSGWWSTIILSWSPSEVFLGPFSQAHTFRHLDVIMLFLRGYASLICGSDLVVNMKWLELHTWWWMIWCPLIFWPTIHLIPYYGIFPFWLRFVDLHWFAWSSLFMRYMSSWWSAFILQWFPSGAFLESFSQTHTLWYCRDSFMELSRVHRLSYHHFSGVQVRSLIHPHWVIIESSGQTKCTSCYTGAYSSFFLFPRWLISHVAFIAFFASHSCDDFVETSLQESMCGPAFFTWIPTQSARLTFIWWKI